MNELQRMTDRLDRAVVQINAAVVALKKAESLVRTVRVNLENLAEALADNQPELPLGEDT